MQNDPNLNPNVTSAGWGLIGKIFAIVVCVVAAIAVYFALTNASDPPASSKTPSKAKSTPGTQLKGTKRDRIPINTICYLGPVGVFNTNEDVTLYMLNVINGDELGASILLSDDSLLRLRSQTNVKVLSHGPYKGVVAPHAPQTTLDALKQFEICQIQILDGSYIHKIGWVLDTELRCPPNKEK